MLISVETELFYSPARALVNPVNTGGVMSSGVSAEFKRFFPGAFSHYRSLCETGQLEPGRLFFWRGDYRTVIHLPIKRHWRSAATTDIIEAGLQKLADTWAEQGIHALALPRLAVGELEWETAVKPLVETYLAPLPIPVYVHHQTTSDPRRGVRQLDHFLNLPPQPVPFEKLWRDLGRIVRRVNGEFSIMDDERVTVVYESRVRAKRLIITPESGTEAIISDSLLRDLWTTACAAGLLLPSQFPGGLETVAQALLAVLDKAEYVRVVRAALGDNAVVPSLLVVPPPDMSSRPVHTLTERSA